MVTTTAKEASAIPGPATEGLRARLRGQLLAPGDEGYDDARSLWNGAIDRRPGLIARCAGVSDVIQAIRFGREHDLLVAVRGGGHGVGGLAMCDGGLVIDVSPMRGIRVDPTRRTARAEAGVLLGELDRETQAFGLAVPAGIVTHTGLAGLTLGGGIGWLMRKHGLTIDRLRAVDLVTADGELLTASHDEHPDLFWGVCGGGGNFGVVTSFEFDAVDVGPTVLAGPVYFPLERADEVLGFYRDWAAAAPDELTTVLNVRRAPSVAFLPEELHGAPVVTIVVCWSGPLDGGERAVRPLRELGPVVDLAQPKPFLQHQSMFDVTVQAGWHYYWKSVEVPQISPEVGRLLVDQAERITSPLSYTIVFQLGGAVARVGEDDTAYSHRDAGFAVNINGVWLGNDERSGDHVGWVRAAFGELEPFAPGVYVNFLGDEGEDRVRAAYGAAKYRRLVRLKNRYDPTNFFHLNQNVRPAP